MIGLDVKFNPAYVSRAEIHPQVTAGEIVRGNEIIAGVDIELESNENGKGSISFLVLAPLGSIEGPRYIEAGSIRREDGVVAIPASDLMKVFWPVVRRILEDNGIISPTEIRWFDDKGNQIIYDFSYTSK